MLVPVQALKGTKRLLIVGESKEISHLRVLELAPFRLDSQNPAGVAHVPCPTCNAVHVPSAPIGGNTNMFESGADGFTSGPVGKGTAFGNMTIA